MSSLWKRPQGAEDSALPHWRLWPQKAGLCTPTCSSIREVGTAGLDTFCRPSGPFLLQSWWTGGAQQVHLMSQMFKGRILWQEWLVTPFALNHLNPWPQPPSHLASGETEPPWQLRCVFTAGCAHEKVTSAQEMSSVKCGRHCSCVELFGVTQINPLPPPPGLCERRQGLRTPVWKLWPKKSRNRSSAHPPFKGTMQHFVLSLVESLPRLQYGRLSSPQGFQRKKKGWNLSSLAATLLWALSAFWKLPRAHSLGPQTSGLETELCRQPGLPPPPASVPFKWGIQGPREVWVFSLPHSRHVCVSPKFTNHPCPVWRCWEARSSGGD